MTENDNTTTEFHNLLINTAQSIARKCGKYSIDIECLWESYIHLAETKFSKARKLLDQHFQDSNWRSKAQPDVIPLDPGPGSLPFDPAVKRLTGPLSLLSKRHGGIFTVDNFIPLLQQSNMLNQVLFVSSQTDKYKNSLDEKVDTVTISQPKMSGHSIEMSATCPQKQFKKEKKDISHAIEFIRQKLESCVFGQTSAIHAFIDALETSLRRPTKKGCIRGNYLIFGPNGCGKSTIIDVIQAWIDEYSQVLPVKKLVYCEGYLHNAMPTLRQQIRQHSEPAVLVFNEFEKYEPELRDVLLEGFSRGELLLPDKGMGGRLEKTDIQGWIIILVGNVGRKFWGRLPFKEKGILPDSELIRETLEQETIQDQHHKSEILRGCLSRSFLDRIETFIPLCQLRYADVAKVLDREIGLLGDELLTRNIKLVVQDRVRELIVLRSHYKRGWSARQILRGFKDNIEGVVRHVSSIDGISEVKLTCADKAFNRIMVKSRPRLLVIDDKLSLVMPILTESMQEKAEVTGAESIEKALEYASSNPFELLLLDMYFDNKPLWREYLAQWRSFQPDTPVALFSGEQVSSSDHIEMDRLGGIIGFLPKRSNPQEMAEAIIPMLDHAVWQARIRAFEEQYGYGGDQVAFDIHPRLKDDKVTISFSNVNSFVSDKRLVTADEPILPIQTVDDINEFLDIFLNAQKRAKLGINRPKGILLYGPPGNGKTMVARSLAHSMRCNFLAMAAGDFQSKWAGVGAEILKELFEKAQMRQPCVVFIDEIDAITPCRTSDTGGGVERDQNNTVATFLTLLDGFEGENDIFVIGATNRKASIDPAILRPGRLDRHIEIPRPGLTERKAILDRCLSKRKLHNLDLDWAAKETFGMSAAEIVQAVNDSVMLTLRHSKDKSSKKAIILSKSHFQEACDRIRYGVAPNAGTINEKILRESRECTAWHEAGHLILSIVLFGEFPERATIVPRGETAGFVRASEEDHKRRCYNFKRSTGVKEIAVCLGGGVAERIKFSEHSAGVANDREKAWRLSYRMVTKWGMGPIEAEAEGWLDVDCVEDHRKSSFLPRMKSSVAKAAAEIVKEAEELAEKELTHHKASIEKAANFLLEHEDIDNEFIISEFGDIYNAVTNGRNTSS